MRKLSLLLLAAAVASTAVAESPQKVKSTAHARQATPSHALIQRSKAVEVLAKKEVAKGVISRVVRDDRGRIYRDLLRNGVATPPPQVRTPRRAAADSEYSLHEDFESFNGTDLDWLPEGWTEINTPENKPTQWMASKNINNTWYATYTGDGYWIPITSDGEKDCFIHFTYSGSYKNENGEEVEFTAAPQDEWLISPAFTLQANHKLFFDLMIDKGGIFSYDWNTSTYDRSVIDHDLEILVSENDGADWTSIWKASADLVADMTDREMYDHMADLEYYPMSLDISRFAGKQIKIAWRYTNAASNGAICGNSMAVDAITVGAPKAVAGYALPQSSLLGEFTRDLAVFNNSYVMLPPYRMMTWPNTSNSFAEAYEWKAYDPETEGFTTYDTKDLTIGYEYSEGNVYPFPTLTSSNAFSTSTYKFDEADESEGGFIVGGSMPSIGEEPVAVSNADYLHKGLINTYLDNSGGKKSWVYGTHQPDVWGDGVVQKAIGELFTEPASPFWVERMLVTCGTFDVDPDVEFTMTIYPLDKWGNMGDPIITGTAKASEAYSDAESGFTNLVFSFFKEDEQGNRTPSGFSYDQQIVAALTGYANNDKVRDFSVASQYFDNDATSNYAYMLFEMPYNGSTVTQWYAANDALQDYSNAVYFGMFGSYYFLEPNFDTISFGAQSLSSTIEVKALTSPDEWWVEDVFEDLPLTGPVQLSWLTITPSVENGVNKLTFSAGPTENGRSQSFIVRSKGCWMRLNVSQTKTGSGVDEIAATNVRISTSADAIVMTGLPTGSQATVCSVDGRVIARATADTLGNATVRSSERGVLLVNAAGKTFKVIK